MKKPLGLVLRKTQKPRVISRKFINQIAEDFMALDDPEAHVASERKLLRRQTRMETWSLLLTFGLFLLNAGWAVHARAEGSDWYWVNVVAAVFLGWQSKRDAARFYDAAEHRKVMLNSYQHLLDTRSRNKLTQ